MGSVRRAVGLIVGIRLCVTTGAALVKVLNALMSKSTRSSKALHRSPAADGGSNAKDGLLIDGFEAKRRLTDNESQDGLS